MIYDIAGLRIDIKNQHLYTSKFCQKYLSLDQDTKADLTASVTEEEFMEEKNASPGFSDGYIENICLYRSMCRQMPQFNRMLLHAAIIEYNGKGYAFLGRSGTGKSTHIGLWIKYLSDVKIVNGDKPILEYTQNGFIAYGTPWMGKEGLGDNTQVSLAGLCFLEQAKENSIERMDASKTSAKLFHQVLLPEDEENVVATLALVDKLILEVPAFLLKCNISEEAVEKSFTALTNTAYCQSRKTEE